MAKIYFVSNETVLHINGFHVLSLLDDLLGHESILLVKSIVSQLLKMSFGQLRPRKNSWGQLTGKSLETLLDLLNLSDRLESDCGGELDACWVELNEDFLEEDTSEVDLENI